MRLRSESHWMGLRQKLLLLAICVVVAGSAIEVMGYHPGSEDDGVYLSAIKSDLNPALYSHDAAFFRLQLQATIFDKCIAGFVRLTGISVEWSELLWQFVSIAMIVFAVWSISRLLFGDGPASWGGVAMVSAMLTLPVAGTALYIADQHLHPRNVSTALNLMAVFCIMRGKRWWAIPLLLLSIMMHPIMGALGLSFCGFLVLNQLNLFRTWFESARSVYAAAIPLSWVFDQPSPAWRHAMATRTYFFLNRWSWYEWLGAIAPLLLFWLLKGFARKCGNMCLQQFSSAVLLFGIFQLTMAVIMLSAPAFVRLAPIQPMRFLQVIYIFMTMIGGCLLGKYLLRRVPWRWGLFLVIVNLGMFAGQRAQFSGSEHLELPSTYSANSWLQAFSWIRNNTPTDAYFVLGPNYLSAEGEDFHSFRALAERSQLADAVKDPSVVAQVPELGTAWERQVAAQSGWTEFTLSDFEHLKREFGVDWALVRYPQPSGLDCIWHNSTLSVCRIP